MKLENTHIQYHPDYDTIFLTSIPNTIGAKSTNYGSAHERELEFFYAAHLWAKRALVVPLFVAHFRKLFRIKPSRQKVSRTWKRPNELMEVTITVVEYKRRAAK